MDRKIFQEVLSSDGGSVVLYTDPRFPMDDVKEISRNLQNWNMLVPGYVPPASGMLSVENLILEANFEDTKTVLLPDRNLITRIASIAKNGVPDCANPPTMMAANLMAFAQAFDMIIEPSVAFHELAARIGNAKALDELSWFRAAEEAQKLAWIDIALGRTRHLPSVIPIIEEPLDFESLPGRWERNYAVALKMAELELQEMPNLDRLLMLLQWMVDDFIYAGPAGCFAAMYFSPTAQRSGMIKQLRSPDRDRAISGVKNAAWDITYISDFIKRAREPKEGYVWYILASADKSLAAVASLWGLGSAEADIAQAYGQWWSEKDALKVADELKRIAKIVSQRPMRGSSGREKSPVQVFIESGEKFVKNWRPA